MAQQELTETWRPQTLCAAGYIVPECSNGTKTGASANPK